MEYIITEKKFKQCSKDLKSNLKNMGFEISLGAAQNLLARTFGSKDYNTILPIIKQQEQNILMFKNALYSFEDYKNNEKESSSIYEHTSIPNIKKLFTIYEGAKKFSLMKHELQDNEEKFKKAQLSLYLDLMLATLESFKFMYDLASEEMDLSFIQLMDENLISTEIKDNYFEALAELILKVIEIVDLSFSNEKPKFNYQEYFKDAFITISSYGINYLTQEQLSIVMKEVSRTLLESEKR